MHLPKWTIIQKRISRVDIDLWFFLAAIAVSGFSGSMVDAVLNNYLSETFRLGNLQRSVLEGPRELPGLLVMFVSAGLFFLCSRRLGVLAMALAALGLVLIGTASISFFLMLCWLFIYSLGQHIFIPLNSSIGMELAREGKTGKRLGQLNAVRNLFIILGSFFVVIGFRFLRFNFTTSFLIAATGFGIAAMLLYCMKKNKPQPAVVHLKLHRTYRLYYWLCVLFGMRKQIFLTFAPWVLVTVYQQPTQTIALLLTIGGIAGIVFQPLLGHLIDTYGEKFVLAGESFVLICVCLLYGFAGTLFSPGTAFIIVASCYIADQLLMSVGMARATYLKKIALDDSHVNAALFAATSIDHVFSITTALVSGIIWNAWGYQYVFAVGAAIAFVNLLSTLKIVVPVTARLKKVEIM